MTETFSIKVVRGHTIVLIDAGPVLLDTGSPTCIGAEPFLFLGRDWRGAEDFMGTPLEELGPHIGADIVGLIGANALRDFSFMIDWERCEFRVSEKALELEGERIELDMSTPVPIVNATVAGARRRLFFDTGAQISYLRKPQLSSVKNKSLAMDFHPSLGEFETETAPLKLFFQANDHEEMSIRFGVLPESLERGLIPKGIDGVLGSELLEYGLGGFDYRENLMILQRRL